MMESTEEAVLQRLVCLERPVRCWKLMGVSVLVVLGVAILTL